MPTRRDSQGVMACELATYGIPLITSKLDVCFEIFDTFENVFFADNSKIMELNYSTCSCKKNKKYSYSNTVKKEIDLIME